MATVVAFHAHPDDEALLTGGTLARLAGIVRSEGAQLLIGYDAQGGYGHRDHVKVHEVARHAHQLLDGVRLLEATAPRELVALAHRAAKLGGAVVRSADDEIRAGFTEWRRIDVSIPVGRHAAAKQAAIRAHASQRRNAGRGARGLAVLSHLPLPLFRLAFGREWFVAPDAEATRTGPRNRPRRTASLADLLG